MRTIPACIHAYKQIIFVIQLSVDWYNLPNGVYDTTSTAITIAKMELKKYNKKLGRKSKNQKQNEAKKRNEKKKLLNLIKKQIQSKNMNIM